MRRLKQVFSIVLLFAVASLATSAQNTAPDLSAQNAALIRTHHDLMNKGDWKAALAGFSEDTKNFGEPVGRDHVAMILQDVWTTFPDFRLEIVDLVSQGDWVVVRCIESGTHLGVGKLPVSGGLLVDVPPTHKHFEVEVTHWWKLRDGKIVDHYGVRDDLGMMEQLGLLAGPKN
jgi:steroid delta-isomerase-like uncharacterized protein